MSNPAFLAPAAAPARALRTAVSSSFTSTRPLLPARPAAAARLSGPSFAPVVASAATSAPAPPITVSRESLEKSKLTLSVTIPGETTKSTYMAVLKEYSQKAEIPGFRKGKPPPMKVVLNMVGKKNVIAATLEQLMDSCSQKAIEMEAVIPVGQVEVLDSEEMLDGFAEGEPFTFRMTVDVFPQIELPENYKNLSVEVEEVPFDEQVMQNALLEIRKREALQVIAPDGATAELGTVCVASMIGYHRLEDGSRGDPLPEIADGKSVEINMEVGKYMKGFVEGIVGMKVGEEKDVVVEFPDNTARVELRGLKAVFGVQLEAVKNTVLPDLDDEFVQKVSSCKTVDELMVEIKARLGEETEKANKENINKAIEKALVEGLEVELPDSMIEDHTKRKFANMMADFKDQGNLSDEQIRSMITAEKYEKYKTSSMANTVRQLKVILCMNAIATREEIKVAADEVDEAMEEYRKELQGQKFDEKELRDKVETQLESMKVMELLRNSANITMVPAKRDE